MRFAVLGPVEVVLDDGRAVTLGSTREGTLLAILLMHAGQPVSSSGLIDALWSGDPPAGAAATLPTYIKNLRRTLGDPTRIVTKQSSYTLRVEAGEFDVWDYERNVAAGRFDEAIALWRGRPLADLADEPFALGWVAFLEERHLNAQHDHIRQLLERGQHRDAIPEIEAILERHPFHERFWGQLMLALYRSGRQAEALRAYGRARELLRDELGIEPGVELRQLEDDILLQKSHLDWTPGRDRAVDAERPAESSRFGTERGRAERLSIPAGLAAELAACDTEPFVGRDADLEWLEVLWRRATAGQPQVAVIDGPTGIGKHRLLAEFARRLFSAGASLAVEPVTDADAPTLVLTCPEQLPDPAALTGPVFCVAAGSADTAPVAAERRTLQSLEPAAIEQLLRGALGEDPEPSLVTAIKDEAGGITARVVELAQGVADRRRAERVERAVLRAESARSSLARDLDEIELSVRRAGRDRSSSPPAAGACPYKGLARFEAVDADLFCGRESLVATLVARLVSARFVAVVGASGSGKSSLVRAGLVPAIAEGVIPGSKSWSSAVVTPSTLAGPFPEVDLLVVDQLEEVLSSPSSASGFADELIERITEYPGRVVVTVRSDHYGHLAAWPALAGRLTEGQLLVGAMTDDELRRAVTEPAHRVGLQVEPELVDLVIADVGGAPGALPLMSTALLETWVRREGTMLTRACYLAAGGVLGAVANLAEGVYTSLTEQQRSTCRRLFLRLTEPDSGARDVRRRALIDELDPTARELLPLLVTRRLVSVDADSCEVTHEALLREWPRLVQWLEEDRIGRRQHRALTIAAAAWEAAGRDTADLYRGTRLDGALEWWSGHPDDLNPTEHDFLEASHELADHEMRQAHRRTRRLSALVAGLAVALVGAVVAGSVAIHQNDVAQQRKATAEASQADAAAQAAAAESAQADAESARIDAESARSDAEARARTASARGLAGQALSLLDVDLDRALLAAVEGYRTETLVETRGALLTVLSAATGLRRSVPFGDDVALVGLDDEGRVAAVLRGDATMQLWDLQQGEPSGPPFPVTDSAATHIAFDSAGERVAIGYESQIEVWSIDGTHLAGPFEGGQGGFIDLAFTADGAHLVATSFLDPGAHIIGLADGRNETLTGPLKIISAEASVDDPVVLTGDVFGTLQRWDLATGMPIDPPVSLATVDFGSKALPSWLLRHLVEEMVTSPDGKTTASGLFGGGVALSDWTTGESRLVIGAEQQTVLLRFSRDGTRLVGVSTDGRARVWDMAKPDQPPLVVPGVLRSVDGATFNPDGDLVLVGSYGARVYDLDAGPSFGTVFTAFPTMGGDAAAYLPSGGLVAVGNAIDLLAPEDTPGALAMWDDHTTTIVRNEPLASGATAVDISPDGRFMAIAEPAREVAIHDVTSGSITVIVGAPGFTVVKFSPAGDLLAVASADDVRWFSVPDWTPLGTTDLLESGAALNPTSLPTGLSFDVAGQTLAVANSQSAAVVIDVPTRAVRDVLVDAAPLSYSATLDHAGSRLFSGSFLGEIRIVDLAHPDAAPTTLISHGNTVTSLALSESDSMLYSTSFDGSLILWDLASGARLGVPLRPGLGGAFGGATSVALSPDGDHAAVVYADGHVVVWEINPEAWAERACAIAPPAGICS